MAEPLLRSNDALFDTVANHELPHNCLLAQFKKRLIIPSQINNKNNIRIMQHFYMIFSLHRPPICLQYPASLDYHNLSQTSESERYLMTFPQIVITMIIKVLLNEVLILLLTLVSD
uniref:Uncharacterized protein n=1 Tax=Glossina austeni TaxID=7395 RepID=A0A1A9VAJ6_GLOAU